jgi:ABC-type multidrug transport system fused ATPase/permease subunit
VLLSGGQRQRISLARALAGSPSLLILDEATSALDRESESLVQESIEALHGKITVVVIAHRLQTIEKADKIIVLEKGRVLEQGAPAELLANPDSYYAKHST